MRKFCFILSLGAACLASQSLHAESATVRQHGAHVHGTGQLNVAIENGQLDIELISPAVNIVGFEHHPETEEQKQAIDAATETLKDLPQIFGLPAEAGCQLAQVEVEATMLEEDEHEHEHEGESQEEHTQAGADEHEHEHEGETHSEFHVHYAIQCATPAALGYIDVLLFQRFSGTKELDAQVIGPNGQTGAELTPSAIRLAL